MAKQNIEPATAEEDTARNGMVYMGCVTLTAGTTKNVTCQTGITVQEKLASIFYFEQYRISKDAISVPQLAFEDKM